MTAANVVPLRSHQLTDPQKIYLHELAQGSSEKEAIAATGMSRQAIWYWKQKPEFAALVFRATRALLELNAAPTAAKVLHDLARDEDMHPKIRMDAAKAILDRTGHLPGAELEMERDRTAGDNEADRERRLGHLTSVEMAFLMRGIQAELTDREAAKDDPEVIRMSEMIEEENALRDAATGDVGMMEAERLADVAAKNKRRAEMDDLEELI